MTGQMAADYFARQADNLEERLRKLPDATELMPLYGGSKPILKSNAPEWTWRQLYEGTESNLKLQLKNAVDARDEFRKNVKNWAPTEIRTIEELEREKQERSEAVRNVRLDRYTVNRDKTIDRIKKAFEKIRRSEEALKIAHDATKIAKLLDAAAAGADAIYSTYVGKPQDLSQKHPFHIDRNEVISDWKVDDILKHMGLIDGSGYVDSKTANKMRDEAYRGREPWPSQGLDYWKPFWPGWDGTIQYPPGSTGKNDDRRSW